MSLDISAVTFNSAQPHRLAHFWAEALGAQVVDGGNGYLHVRAAGMLIIVQSAPEHTSGNPTDVHLDLRADDRVLESQRLVGLGATLLTERSDSHGTWSVLTDPDEREFCIG
ncbi:VOC family protein [Oerskovia sp. NPDC060287]|uniref:VOC family protein n=1 Tax=Oerskovia sp. NPDC060287 TaxID=3347095 RepID=UPI00365FF39D